MAFQLLVSMKQSDLEEITVTNSSRVRVKKKNLFVGLSFLFLF